MIKVRPTQEPPRPKVAREPKRACDASTRLDRLAVRLRGDDAGSVEDILPDGGSPTLGKGMLRPARFTLRTPGTTETTPWEAPPGTLEVLDAAWDNKRVQLGLIPSPFGGGAQGGVYPAFDLHDPKQRYAVKITSAGSDDSSSGGEKTSGIPASLSDGVERQLLAGRVSRSLGAPLGAATDGENVFYIMHTMTAALSDVFADLRGRPAQLRQDVMLSLLPSYAAQLHNLHVEGFIHGDVKPGNATVVQVFDRTVVNLIDFDNTHSVEDFGARNSGGTPEYYAPELAVWSGAIDQTCDVFALGLVAHEGATGNHLFASYLDINPAAGYFVRWEDFAAWQQGKTHPAFDAAFAPLHDAFGLAQIIKDMTRMAPAERPSASQVQARASALRDALPAERRERAETFLRSQHTTADAVRSLVNGATLDVHALIAEFMRSLPHP